MIGQAESTRLERTTERVLDITGLGIGARRGGRPVSIVDGVDLHVAPGEAIAIVGESGSGKSLTVRALLDLLPSNVEATGDVQLYGRPLAHLTAKERHALRGRELAFVMQDPFTMLNPLQRCGEQVMAALAHRGTAMSRDQRNAEAVARLREVGITDPAVADRYPFELSGGMRQRVAIAAAIAEKPRVLIADEPTTALDVTTQKEILALLDRLRHSHGLSLILITHDLDVAFTVSDRVYVMYAGTVVETGRSTDVADRPRHPYTYSLIQAKPPLDVNVDRLLSIPGSVPAPGDRPHGCRFATRCTWAVEKCTEEHPPLLGVGPDHQVRCVRADEIAVELTPRADPAARATAASREGDGEPLVRIRGARKVFGQAHRATVAVHGADVDVLAGESVGLVGESGSGKTTLARMIVGLTRPTAGEVVVGGVDLGARKLTTRDWAVVRSTAQMAFQDPYSTLNPFMSVGATLHEALRLAVDTSKPRRPADLLELVGLSASYERRRPAQLSGGERQRIAIARALARNPRLIVCDEVVSALDVSVQAHILNLLSDLRDELGLSYLFITHDLAVVRQVTERIYVLKDGHIVEQGPTAGLLDNPQHSYTQQLIRSIPTHRRSVDDHVDQSRSAS